MKQSLGSLSLGAGNRPPRYVTDFFNGFNLPGSTFSGGPTVVEDHEGTIVTSPAGVLPMTGMRLATTVEEGAALGDELIVNGDFSAWTGDNPTNWTVTENGTTTNITEVSGGARIISVDGTNVFMYANSTTNFLTIGKKYLYEVVIDVASGGLKTDAQFPPLTYISGSGTYTGTFTATSGRFNICRHSGVIDVTVSSVSIREVIPTWLPTTSLGAPIHTSTPLRTRKGTVSVYSEDFKGPMIEPPRTNKVTCRKANPVDTTNITKSGDAAAVLSVVDDSAALAAAGLDKICTSGKVYELDGTTAIGASSARPTGIAGNTNKHSYRAYIRLMSGSGTLGLSASGVPSQVPLSVTAAYVEYKVEDFTPQTGDYLFVRLDAGSKARFILLQLEEGAFATSPIALASDGSDPLTALTRPAANLTRPTAGTALAALNNWAIRARFRPTAAGQTAVLWGSYTDANNATRLNLAPTTLTYTKRLAGVDHVAQASLTHAAATLYEALLYQHSVHGMGIAFRSWNGSAWSSWSTWVDLTDANGIANASIAATYQSGAVNNSSHVCANLPFVEVVTVPASVNPQSWLMDKISKNRI